MREQRRTTSHILDTPVVLAYSYHQSVKEGRTGLLSPTFKSFCVRNKPASFIHSFRSCIVSFHSTSQVIDQTCPEQDSDFPHSAALGFTSLFLAYYSSNHRADKDQVILSTMMITSHVYLLSALMAASGIFQDVAAQVPTPLPTRSPTTAKPVTRKPVAPVGTQPPNLQLMQFTTNRTKEQLVQALIASNGDVEFKDVVSTSNVGDCGALYTGGHTLGNLMQRGPGPDYALETDANGNYIPTTTPLVPNEGIILSSGDPRGFNWNDADDLTKVFSESSVTTHPLLADLRKDVNLQSGRSNSFFDGCAISFKFRCTSDAYVPEVSFKYVFGSEEYYEYVDSAFNDAFGFYLNQQNIAKIPTTTTSSNIVSINNVNYNANKMYFNGNDPGNGWQVELPDAPDSEVVYPRVEADGFTNQLTARGLPVTDGGGWNNMTLVISDVGDPLLDSWVLLEKSSFTCVRITSAPTTSMPTSTPTLMPTSTPTLMPTTSKPTSTPSSMPTTSKPTSTPTSMPTTSKPTSTPTLMPTTSKPTTSKPTSEPTSSPSVSSKPSGVPSSEPSVSTYIEADDVEAHFHTNVDADDVGAHFHTNVDADDVGAHFRTNFNANDVEAHFHTNFDADDVEAHLHTNFDANDVEAHFHTNFDADDVEAHLHTNFDADDVEAHLHTNFDANDVEAHLHTNFDADDVEAHLHTNFDADDVEAHLHTNFDADDVEAHLHTNFDADDVEAHLHTNFDADDVEAHLHTNFDADDVGAHFHTNFYADDV
ncbi:hypothetical protein ACHAW5_001279 [Stephanodiscus triporus]|uniref:Uncharacterized protein n=1 Tax=Stephanodiscus triporus TaxID=2934178 RepID=A0ABD3QDZ6_9STRA